MAVKTRFTAADFKAILSHYEVGDYLGSDPVQQGTVQTNYFLRTARGRFVFRYYENRPRESVLFESELLAFLAGHDYPCPRQIERTDGDYVGAYGGRPYILFAFVEGAPVAEPSFHHWQQLAEKAAMLQTLTRDYQSQYIPYRWNYNPDLCRQLARTEAEKLDTPNAYAKYDWLDQTLNSLELPPAVPKGICHCDFHFSNVFFQGEKFVVLLDFDDANYTFLQFDLVGLIEYWAWPHAAEVLDLAKARTMVDAYTVHRPLPPIEQRHLFDVYKLSILIDCIWFFARGAVDDFYERRKIEALDSLGREHFQAALFSNSS